MHWYSALLNGAAPGLDCASCLHVDDIDQPPRLDSLMKVALNFFDTIGEKPKRVSYWLANEPTHRRSSIRKFINKFENTEYTVGDTMRSVAITSAGFESDDLSDTWTPRAVASVSRHGKTIKAFFQSSRELEKESEMLLNLPHSLCGTMFSAAYVFEYPFVFSPLAYSSGLSYSPSFKKWGDHTDRDAERVANWSNHCYQGQRGSEGYMRDIYPMNLIGPEHLGMVIGKIKLENWISQDPTRGRLLPCHGKVLWIIKGKEIRSVQTELDQFEILLSSFPPR